MNGYLTAQDMLPIAMTPRHTCIGQARTLFVKKHPSEEQIRARLRELTEEARRSRNEFSRPGPNRLRFEPRGKPSNDGSDSRPPPPSEDVDDADVE